MGASNTLSEQPWGGSSGSPSEGTADVELHDSPELTLPDQASYTHTVPGSDAHGSFGFARVQGLGH